MASSNSMITQRPSQDTENKGCQLLKAQRMAVCLFHFLLVQWLQSPDSREEINVRNFSVHVLQLPIPSSV